MPSSAPHPLFSAHLVIFQDGSPQGAGLYPPADDGSLPWPGRQDPLRRRRVGGGGRRRRGGDQRRAGGGRGGGGEAGEEGRGRRPRGRGEQHQSGESPPASLAVLARLTLSKTFIITRFSLLPASIFPLCFRGIHWRDKQGINQRKVVTCATGLYTPVCPTVNSPPHIDMSGAQHRTVRHGDITA